MRTLLSAVVLFLWAAPSLAGDSQALSPDEVGRLLAGTNPGAFPDKDLKETLEWYSERMGGYWKTFEERKGAPMRRWAAKALDHDRGETIFYPFGGPDLPTAVRFYPEASRYVLVGLEKGGPVPRLDELSAREIRSLLRLFVERARIYSNRGFFITSKMKSKWHSKKGVVWGVTGLLLMFAEVEGFDVKSIKAMRVKEDGSGLEPHPADPSDLSTWNSVRIELTTKEGGRPVTLDYLSLNLSDRGLKKDEAHRKWVEKLARERVMIKAASHLLQTGSFRIVRDILVKNARSVVQDETSLPYSDLAANFETRLFGTFKGVNPAFSKTKQSVLVKAYKERKDIEDLPFRISYHKTGGSCLIYAFRKAR